ncbi:hypothetical protein KY319_04065 [Candidatus Woesearchaeota archaeon]|nr:hypothetical protein [Candidatus Woesearchaeota archaeon]
MRFNKKAALELSITAIVVLIIAITVLGLGIGFIKKQFGAGAEMVTQELVKIKDQLKEQVRTGGELLVFSIPDQIKSGTPQAVLIGIRNTAANFEGKDRVCFRVEVKCIKPFTPDAQCVPDVMGPVAVGGYAPDEGWAPVKGNHNWFRSILGEFDLKNYEGDVFDAIMQVRGIKPDSYQMEINVYKAIDDKACVDGPDFSDKNAALYASKSFILNVV